MNECVDILLATYNGEKYVTEQIKSILHQTYRHFHLYIRDDGSKDQTLSIITDFAQKYPDVITIISSTENLGVKLNFSSLMTHSKSAYIMFSDQDDYWEKDKIWITIEKMQSLESEWGTHTPCLVHTDLSVVDSDLKPINPSFWKYTNRKPCQSQTLNRLIVQNVVTGCSTMINRALLELALPIPLNCVMHDWWIALVAAAFGKIEAVKESTIYYRQHGGNSLGAKKFLKLANIIEGLKRLTRRDDSRRQQAMEFLSRYDDRLDRSSKEVLETYIQLPQYSWIKRRYLIFKHQYFKNGLFRNVATLLSRYP